MERQANNKYSCTTESVKYRDAVAGLFQVNGYLGIDVAAAEKSCMYCLGDRTANRHR